jgi:pentatricopeptide repeat protein
MKNTMMDIYAHARRFDIVETMFHEIEHPDTAEHNILVKAYGKGHQPERAENVVRKMFDNPQTAKPNIEIMNCLLNAWAESAATYGNAAESAYNVFRWIYDDPKFSSLQIRPNVITYSTLLKCLATCGSVDRKSDIGEKVEAILDELESRYNSGDTSCQPDVQLYTAAIKAFLSTQDFDRADALLKRMEQHQSNVSESSGMEYMQPNERTYSEFLTYFAKMGTFEAAKRAEQMLHHMRTLSQSKGAFSKPNVYTYNIVMNAWAVCGDPSAADRIWKIYEEMVTVDNLEFDHVTVNVLMKVFSQAKRTDTLSKSVSRSVHVLKSINNCQRIIVSSHIYITVLNSCMKLNDHETAAQVLKLMIDACVAGRCRLDVSADRAKYNWIMDKWITFGKLSKATLYLETIIHITTKATNASKLIGIGPDLSTVLDLRKAWTTSSHPEKHHYVTKMDTEIIPALVRSLNIQKGNVPQ